MSLNGYVRQLKPRTENYIPPVDRVQDLLESKMVAADWEQVIAVAYNMTSGMSKEQAISSAELKEWKPKYEEVLPVGLKIIENSFGKSPSNIMVHYGQGQGTLTKEWDDYFVKMTGKSASSPTKTPKETPKWNKLYWTPRGKPAGIGGKNPSDTIIDIGGGNDFVGFSNKKSSGNRCYA
jgi:hypothetical protein